MAEPIDVIQQALNALAVAGLCIRIETAINNETGETNEHHQR